MDFIEQSGNQAVDFCLNHFYGNRLEKQAAKLYTQISEKLDRLPSDIQNPESILVMLNSRDVTITGFWARVYEDCVAGIEYIIRDKHKRINLVSGEMPLHSAPWRYDSARIEGSAIANMVARHLVTRQNRNGANVIVTQGEDHQTVYTSCDAIPLMFERFLPSLVKKTKTKHIPRMSFEVLVHYPLPEIHT